MKGVMATAVVAVLLEVMVIEVLKNWQETWEWKRYHVSDKLSSGLIELYYSEIEYGTDELRKAQLILFSKCMSYHAKNWKITYP